MKILLGGVYKFGDLPDGSLFILGNCLALKSEYSTDGYANAYIVGSGEYFAGGVSSKKERDQLLVVAVDIDIMGETEDD